MSEIIEFPTKQVRDWAVIERSLVPILRKANVSVDAENELLDRMKNFWGGNPPSN
jgi:hypothetical protein